MHAASICAKSCDAVSVMSCNSLYGLLTQFIICVFSSIPSLCLQMSILSSFVLCLSLLYIVYRVLKVCTIGAMSETENLSCYVAMVSLLLSSIISSQSHLERAIVILWYSRKLADSFYVFPLIRTYVLVCRMYLLGV